KWSDKKKVPIFGMVERNRVQSLDGQPVTVTKHGKVAAFVVPSTRAATLTEHVEGRLDPAATVYTDEGGLRVDGHKRRMVNHSKREYVRGVVHTNTIEGFWSLVKRGIDGTHHAVSREYLQGYVNEYVWRYNHRGDEQSLFALLILRSAFPVSR
ncbi:MAG: IS1595 family transposase, partial [Acidimicrobiales bacterium]